ncbi:type II toxin-antitoxin system antitoxin DNA ADP-ribosyl glycohydrolase DarG [Endozoicomonas euniceicola]|uniref:Macro domain-containing protein n=1 Tax=Endozoicomonas euniceicola TaxID=1234143 RepID=A0ABY6GWE8_9GAMM|nr:macro domain-containing protein [Endozoicomonas euniceicola]UYM17090.1 macro domain-containing protein [Endozoicomonas euniceicola]
MIKYTTGNLLDAPAEALVNTVNTVGVMGKGIALMFKERFDKNMKEYVKACKAKEVQVGKMFVTKTDELIGPHWVVNFPTKKHWRYPSKMEWVVDGLQDLKRFILEENVRSIAIPPLGAGNGGLPWPAVREQIELALSDLHDVEILIFEPTAKYQNIAKSKGAEKLTPARALIAELIRRYWVPGMECSLLEVQKLAWVLERVIEKQQLENPLQLQFSPENYGPYANRLQHVLNHLDGSYLKSDKRIADSSPLDVIRFNEKYKIKLQTYLESKATKYLPALEEASKIISGFESPFGLELLTTVDWLISRESCNGTVDDVMEAIKQWPAGSKWASRKEKLFSERDVSIALSRLQEMKMAA